MPDVLIFDDDPSVGALVSEVLRGRGLTATHFSSGAGVLQIVQDVRPRLVILDVMMPGVDGLTACRTIRSHPSTRHVKIVLLTAKNFGEDRATAQRYGADLFVNKPFSPVEFARSIGRMLGAAEPPPPGSQPPAPPVIVTPLTGAAIVELPDFWIFFDAGTGLGRWMMGRTTPPKACWMLITRYDVDAVSEISAAAALLGAGCRVNIAGPDHAEGLLQRLAPRMTAPLASNRITPMLYPQREGEFQIAPGLTASTRYTQHPGTCLAYRLDIQGRKVVYCPVNEIPAQAADWNRHEREKFKQLFADAGLLLHGYRRSLSDPAPQDGRGRAAWEPVVDLACEARVRDLALLPLAGAPTQLLEPELAARRAKLLCATNCSLVKFNERYIL